MKTLEGNSHINWDAPPSRRRLVAPSLRRPVYDVLVIAACGTIDRILIGALLAESGVSQQGIRHFVINSGIPGATALLWGVLAVTGLAALYCLVDLFLFGRSYLQYSQHLRRQHGSVDS